ncbi:hypothetical protein EI94DRAFT_1748797 [Lactarius quietus]|nr:hypothetical protein EI94DRAFT_1748797 [Lactarius quietus]
MSTDVVPALLSHYLQPTGEYRESLTSTTGSVRQFVRDTPPAKPESPALWATRKHCQCARGIRETRVTFGRGMPPT